MVKKISRIDPEMKLDLLLSQPEERYLEFSKLKGSGDGIKDQALKKVKIHG